MAAVTLLAQPDVNSYSLEKERALGEALASDVRRQSAPLSQSHRRKVGLADRAAAGSLHL
ncbi:MAG: hypothetical protein SFV51_19055 [Bryobacteraceae bacterium]|nr:hypothetical protein [Bryobacteraceae bacterium]